MKKAAKVLTVLGLSAVAAYLLYAFSSPKFVPDNEEDDFDDDDDFDYFEDEDL